MVQKGERPVGGERGEPEGKTGKLHRHGIQVDAVQTALGHHSSNRYPFSIPKVTGMASAATKHCRLVGLCQVATGGNEECPASHGGVDHSKLKYAFGLDVFDQRPKRSPDQVVGDWEWRVERPRGLSRSGSTHEFDECRSTRPVRFV